MYNKIKSLLSDTFDTQQIILEKPKNKDLGHFATTIAFNLAKKEKQTPKILAEQLVEKMKAIDSLSSIITNINALNGFINFSLSNEFLSSVCEDYLHNEKTQIAKKERILLEFVSANPTGPLHIGHARGAVYGETLCSVGRYLGYEITKEYYINDAGAQISMLGLSILLAGKEHILKQAIEYPEQFYRGEYVIDLAFQAQNAFGNEIFTESNIPKLAEFGKDKMLEEIKQNLAQLNIYFDNFVSEKSLYNRWDETLLQLQNNGGVAKEGISLEEGFKNQKIIKSDGGENELWLKSTLKGDSSDRVIVRSNGEPTYLAGDIIYHNDKFNRNFDRYINIWGADHHGYIARVKAAIDFLGFDSAKLEVLLSQMVSLLKDKKPYKMSKRAGNFILLKDIVSEIGGDALKFIFLSKKADTHLEFDIATLSKQDSSNPIFYINYANARIHTLFEKSTFTLEQIKSAKLLLDSNLSNLLFEALCINQVLELAFRDREIQKICEYLKSLSSNFHSFYNAQKILDSSNELSVLKVLMCVSKSLTLGMSLLGIEIKTRM